MYLTIIGNTAQIQYSSKFQKTTERAVDEHAKLQFKRKLRGQI